MIRLANKFDKPQIIEMLRMFRDESPIEQYKSLENVEYISALIDSILVGRGVIYIEQDVGMIIGIIQPAIWCDKTFVLHELAWFVKPEHRHTTIGYKLLKKYLDYAKALKDANIIKMFTLSKLTTSPNMKYEKFGLVKIEENWICHD